MLEFANARIEQVADMPEMVFGSDLLFPGRNLTDLEAHKPFLDPVHVNFTDQTIHLALHSFLLQVGGLNILIDTCVGEHKHRPLRSEWHLREDTGYLKRLAGLGLQPEDIDLVMCTHLHADHVGWNTRLENGAWVPTFPKARYVIGRREFEYWQQKVTTDPQASHGVWHDSFAPVLEAGQVEIMDDGASLCEDIDLLPLPGHTPGQSGLKLCCGTRELRFVGDAIHSPLQVFAPDWTSAFCTDPAAATATRQMLMAHAAETDAILLPAHIKGGNGGLRIKRANDGFIPEIV